MSRPTALGAGRVALVAAVAVLACWLLTSHQPAAADDGHTVAVAAVVDGEPAEGAGNNDPVQLFPLRVIDVELVVENTTDDTVGIRRARLFGEAFSLNFVAYDALINVELQPGETKRIQVPVEFIDLERQATGLLPGGVALYDDSRQVIGEQNFIIDVRGSVTSALGIFGFIIVIGTALGIFGVVRAVQRRSLGRNRIRRAVRFAALGLGAGMSCVVALAVFRVMAPTPSVWIPFTVVPTLLGALLGLISPGPLSLDDLDDVDDLDDLEDLDRYEEPSGAADVVDLTVGAQPAAGPTPGAPPAPPSTDGVGQALDR